MSEVRNEPGPTDSIFDVLAAAVACFSPGVRVAMLGFAAGGMIAPLRALGFTHAVQAVDLSLEGMPLFESCRGEWTGEVQVHQADAFAWLEKSPHPFDAIVEDLSIQIPGDVTKPPFSFDSLPGLIARSLSPQGLAVVNVLPVEGVGQNELLTKFSGTYRHVSVVHFESFANTILLGGSAIPSAREIALKLRRSLEQIGSELATEIRVRSRAVEAKRAE